MKLELSDLVNKDNLPTLKTLLNEHRVFMNKVFDVVSILYQNSSEIFRRPPEKRLKEIISIYDKLIKWDVDKGNVLNALNKIHDIAGIRLTIATKDQYKIAEELLRNALLEIGIQLEVSRKRKKSINIQKKLEESVDELNKGKVDAKWDKTGYDAMHFVAIENHLFCEIQVRTLSQDLWAVFSHYESYKFDPSNFVKKELVNLAKLMDVADNYAQVVRGNKIEEAEKFHQEQTNINEKANAIKFNELEKILTTHSKHLNSDPNYILNVDVLDLCRTLKMLHKYNIYTKIDVENLFNNSELIEFIRNQVEIIGVTDLTFLDSFHLLCMCSVNKSTNFRDRINDMSMTKIISAKIEAYKYDSDLQKMVYENPIKETLEYLVNNSDGTEFREICDCVFGNKCARIERKADKIKLTVERLAMLGLSSTVSQKSYKKVFDNNKGSWSSLIVECSEEEPNAMKHIYIHIDKNICACVEYYDNLKNDLLTGLMFNYPKCCIEKYIQCMNLTEIYDPIDDIIKNNLFNGDIRTYSSSNPFARYFGKSLYSHYPCTLNCEETKSASLRSLKTLKDNFPELATEFIRIENSFVIYCKDVGLVTWSGYSINKSKVIFDLETFQGLGELANMFNGIQYVEVDGTKISLIKDNIVEHEVDARGYFIGAFKL